MSGSTLPAEPPWDYAGLFAVERDRLNEVVGGLGAADWERPSPCPGWTVLALPGPVPTWLDQARELSEYRIHRQQILQALGRLSDLRADLAGPVLDALRWAYPYRLGQIRTQPGDTVTITVTGPVTRTWQLVAGTAGWTYHEQPASRVIASLTMTTERAWRLLTNNLPAASRAHVAASGDIEITNILLRTRAIIGTPKWT